MNLINITLKFVASSSYTIIYIYANNLFLINVRNTGMGICSMVARIGTFSNNNFNTFMDSSSSTFIWWCFIFRSKRIENQIIQLNQQNKEQIEGFSLSITKF